MRARLSFLVLLYEVDGQYYLLVTTFQEEFTNVLYYFSCIDIEAIIISFLDCPSCSTVKTIS